MMPRPRRTLSRPTRGESPPQRKKLFARLGIGIFLAVLVFSVWTAVRFKPRSVICETDIHTYCQSEEESVVARLKDVSFWSIPEEKGRLLQELQVVSPSLNDLTLMRTFDGKVVVEISYSEALFPLQIEGQNFTVRENGILTPNPEPAPIAVVLDPQTTWEEFLNSAANREETLKSLQGLVLSTIYFRPTIRKITLITPENIEAFPEGGGKILLHVRSVSELQQQMSTLQAFFHSTTMEEHFTELDVRFGDVIVR